MSRRFPDLRAAAGALLAAAAVACASAPPAAPPEVAFAPRAERAIFICLDGVREDVFRDEIARGNLPAFAFLDTHALRFERATTIYPSITFAAQAAAMTGRLPNRSGIPGIRWFDRERVANRSYAGVGAVMLDADLMENAKTFFEFAGPGERGYSVVLQPARGALRIPPLNWEDNWRGSLLARQYEGDSPPVMAGIWFTSVDHPAHEHGGLSSVVRFRLRETDRALGRVIERLARRGLLATTAFALFSDHGHHDIAVHEDHWNDLRSLGLTPRKIILYNARMNLGGYFDVVAWIGGDGYAILYVPAGGVAGPAAGLPDWSGRPSGARLRDYPIRGSSIDLAESVAALPGVAWVAYREGETGVAVVATGGEGRFEASGAGVSKTSLSYSYRLLRGEDPLGYAGLADGRNRTAQEWLEATADSSSPDAPVLLFGLLEGPRAPDLFVAAKPGIELAASPHHSRHGGVTVEEMRVPAFVSGAGVTPGRVRAARTIDLLPTVLEAMGRLEGFDGDGASRVREGESSRE